jgi:NADH-quinone oxidoreductase subunit L
VVWVPLVALAIPSVVIGYMTIDPMLYGDFFKGAIVIDESKHGAMKELAEAFQGPMAMALHGFASAPFWLALAGVVATWYMYLVNPALPAAIKRAFGPIYTLLENKYYMDWFNENVIARATRALGVGLWKGGDEGVIDGAIVNGSWKVVGRVAGVVRWFKSGYIYHYAFAMLLGIFVLMSYFVWFNR